MEIKKLPYIYHGSEDSIDKDIYVLCEESLDAKESLELVKSFYELGFNANPVFIKNGFVQWNFKGTNDEIQNSIMKTYGLHNQIVDLPIESMIERNHGIKALRTLRGILSQCSRTQYRDIVKKALKDKNVFSKLETLEKIDFSSIEDYEKISKVEVGKFFAFQFGQTIALLSNNVELFTKKTIAEYFPDLKDFLYRKENVDFSVLNEYKNIFVKICRDNFKQEEGSDTVIYKNNFLFYLERINVLEEQICE